MAKKRSWIAYDRFAIEQVSREHDLSGAESSLLVDITRLCNPWKGPVHSWSGPLWQLVDASRFSRPVVTRAVTRLADAGLIEVTKPFTQGGEGRLTVLVYDRLVVPRNEWNLRRSHTDMTEIDDIVNNDQPKRGISYGSKGREVEGSRVTPTRDDRFSVGHFDQLRRQFPGAEEVS